MERKKLTKAAVDRTTPGDYLLWDAELRGFALRVFPSGRRSWVIQYRTAGRTRRHTLGSYPPVTPEQARRKAAKLLAEVRVDGRDPSRERRELLAAPTVADLAERYRAEHLPKLAGTTQGENERILKRHVLPALGGLQVAGVSHSDVTRLHARLHARPVMANRVLFLVSALFGLAERWGMRAPGTNPARHVERFPEKARERHLDDLELRKLGKGLAACEEAAPLQIAAIRLLVFTFCRRSEILGLEWDRVDLDRGLLVLSDHKAARHHGPKIVLLNALALEVLAGLPRTHPRWVFPNPKGTGPLREIRKTWANVKAAGGLDPELRLHDLRHTGASQGLLEGLSLPAIGALLGHSRATTTQRYAHWAQDPLREASETVGARLAKAMGEAKNQP